VLHGNSLWRNLNWQGKHGTLVTEILGGLQGEISAPPAAGHLQAGLASVVRTQGLEGLSAVLPLAGQDDILLGRAGGEGQRLASRGGQGVARL